MLLPTQASERDLKRLLWQKALEGLGAVDTLLAVAKHMHCQISSLTPRTSPPPELAACGRKKEKKKNLS